MIILSTTLESYNCFIVQKRSLWYKPIRLQLLQSIRSKSKVRKFSNKIDQGSSLSTYNGRSILSDGTNDGDWRLTANSLEWHQPTFFIRYRLEGRIQLKASQHLLSKNHSNKKDDQKKFGEALSGWKLMWRSDCMSESRHLPTNTTWYLCEIGE